ncbi:MAG: GDP-mannose 4,6-dehydratase [Candidatus Zixiibacteriota bacterium]
MARVLITGIAGFAGSHLAQWCLTCGDEVAGVVQPGTGTGNLTAIRRSLHLVSADLLKGQAVARLIRDTRPEWVIHLAASTSVGDSFTAPHDTIVNNVVSTVNLLEAMRCDPMTRKNLHKIIMVASTEIYGRVRPGQIPLNETTPLSPVNPYGASKAAADLAALSYQESFGLPIIRVRVANHTGPRQRPGFVVPDFCQAIARLERQSTGRVIKVGNLSARRDFSDVRDIVKGYRQLAEQGQIGTVYHLGSGKARTIESVLNSLLELAEKPIRVRVDQKKLRPVEVPLLRADISRARRDAGYRPAIPWAQTLRDTLEYYREREN